MGANSHPSHSGDGGHPYDALYGLAYAGLRLPIRSGMTKVGVGAMHNGLRYVASRVTKNE